MARAGSNRATAKHPYLVPFFTTSSLCSQHMSTAPWRSLRTSTQRMTNCHALVSCSGCWRAVTRQCSLAPAEYPRAATRQGQDKASRKGFFCEVAHRLPQPCYCSLYNERAQAGHTWRELHRPLAAEPVALTCPMVLSAAGSQTYRELTDEGCASVERSKTEYIIQRAGRRHKG
eukprot:361217-Chlamydomonas_euryale.AAC.7